MLTYVVLTNYFLLHWVTFYKQTPSDFISATERFSDEPRLGNACNTSFGTVTKTS